MFHNLKMQLVLISVFFVSFNCGKEIHIYDRSQCIDNEWACDNGQCILVDKLCDGKVDCRDRSDEIAENCIHFHENCQNVSFRCAYGACIDGKAKCNGIRDCADNSDELICIEKDDLDFQGVCFVTEIQCLYSKECINSIDLCNGRKDCRDGSDESLELCVNFHCIGFKCGYGACISRNAKCNGINECADGSDEAWQLCNTSRKTNNSAPSMLYSNHNGCYLPNITKTQDLIFKLHPQNEIIPIGSFVNEYDKIHIECQNNFTLIGQSSLLCINGKWDLDFPSCPGYCDGTLLQGLSVRTICNYRNRSGECPIKIYPGTKIQLTCSFGYTRNPHVSQFINCLPDGIFDSIPLPCDQDCGRVASNSSLAPWHVNIYENNRFNYDYICGGTIVSPRVVITAAHCFWDIPNLTLRNYTEYQIIAGRSTTNYTTEENYYSQIVQVDEIHIPQNHRATIERRSYDIAFVKLKTSLRYSETIGPICLRNKIRKTTSNYEMFNQPGFMTPSNYVMPNKTGFITIFGVNNHLKRLIKMTTLGYRDCYDRSPPNAPIGYVIFCIINTEGGSVCRTDSGAGFFTENSNSDGVDIIYILLGVISNTPSTKNDCTRVDDNDAFVAVTNIHYMTSEFKRKLLNAIKEDQILF